MGLMDTILNIFLFRVRLSILLYINVIGQICNECLFIELIVIRYR